MKRSLLLALLLAISITTAISPPSLSAQLPPGIPRGDIIIFRTEITSKVADDINPWKPANPNIAGGGSPVFEPIWYLDVVRMQLVPMLAIAPPEYNQDYTVMRIRVRPGVYWNDGVEFTADDIVFTLKLHLNVTGLAQSAYTQTWVKNAYSEDKYTAVIELKKPNPKFHMTFTCVLGLTGFLIMPKHIWEKVDDPLKFKFNPPVGTGPYILDRYDPYGYWALFRRRDDWERTATGKVFGRPKPKYMLRIYYDPGDPKQIIAISRHEMDITELTMELWDTAKSANPFINAFWPSFPYAWQHGICDHGPCFNLAKYPYNITDVRWALTLAINITEVNIIALDAKGRIATFRSVSVPYLQVHYESKLLPWIRDFTLSDGYKPFDDTIPYKLAEYVKSKGYILPYSPEKIWNVGWWRYDPKEATKLLEKHGFYRDKEGRWRLPTGEVWTINFLIPAFHVLGSRLGFAVVEQWRKFGIEIMDEALPAGVFTSRYNTGDFDVIIQWPFCSAHVDTWQWWQSFHSMYVKPIGEVATSNQIRWNNGKFSKLLDELAKLTPEDPRVIDLVSEMVKISIEDMPVINFFLGSKLIVFDTYVWTGWPTVDNWYWEHAYWNAMWCLPVLTKLEPTGNVPTSEIIVMPPTYNYVTAYAKTYIPAFTGIDGKSYGPYKAGDAMLIPKDDADKLVIAGLATYTPPVPAEISEAISALLERISRLEVSLKEVSGSISTMRTELTGAISSLSKSIDALSGQVSSITNTMMGIGTITIVLVIIAILMVVRKK